MRTLHRHIREFLFDISNCFFFLPDARLPPHSAGVQSSGTLQRPGPSSKPQSSRRAKDVQSDQLQRAAALGPPGSPQGGRSPEPKGDQLKKLEQRLEQLAAKLDILTTQVELNTIT